MNTFTVGRRFSQWRPRLAVTQRRCAVLLADRCLTILNVLNENLGGGALMIRICEVQYHGNLSLVIACFQQDINLVSFFLGKLCVTHCVSLSWRLEKAGNDTAAYLLANSGRVALTS